MVTSLFTDLLCHSGSTRIPLLCPTLISSTGKKRDFFLSHHFLPGSEWDSLSNSRNQISLTHWEGWFPVVILMLPYQSFWALAVDTLWSVSFMGNKTSLKKRSRQVFSEHIGLVYQLVYLLLPNNFSPNLVALKNDIYFLIVSVG